jgi:hypothetical protein
MKQPMKHRYADLRTYTMKRPYANLSRAFSMGNTAMSGLSRKRSHAHRFRELGLFSSSWTRNFWIARKTD